MSKHILLIEDNEGGVIGVAFPSADAARDWEDTHEVSAVGCVPLMTPAAALRHRG